MGIVAFIIVGIVAGFVARFSGSDIARAFVAGARDLLSAALIVGIARGIVVVAEQTRILDTVLYGMATALRPLPGPVSLNLMFVFQSLLNFLLPSGSGLISSTTSRASALVSGAVAASFAARLVAPVASATTCSAIGSTSSMTAMGALSPLRLPILMIRV